MTVTLVQIVTGDRCTTLEQSPGRYVIGRGGDVDLPIRDDAMSRRHLELEIGDVLRARDLESSNGTRVAFIDGPTHDDNATRLFERLGAQWTELGATAALCAGETMVVVRRIADPEPIAAFDLPGLVLEDPVVHRVAALLRRTANAPLPVLLLGETGTGKDVFARAVHQWSNRCRRTLISVNCATIMESLADSELFGHDKGAFTGAIVDRLGVFEAADGGTLFLDEVGELSRGNQARLLRVLEDGTVFRIGSTTPRRVDVRVIAATSRNLPKEIAAGTFREDLLFRLCGLSVTLPPLRERPADIKALAALFIARTASDLGIANPPEIPDAVLAALVRYPWPGNIRELRHAIERALVAARGGALTVAAFGLDDNARAPTPTPTPRSTPSAVAGSPPPVARGGGDEREQIIQALRDTAGNQSKAAQRLGMSRRTFVRRLGELGLPRPRK